MAEGLGAALNFAAGFNPLCTFFEGVTGQNAAGECVPKWQQAIDLATILLPHIKIPHIPGRVAPNSGRLARTMRKLRSALMNW